MAKEKKERKSYKLTVYDEESLSEKWTFRLTSLNIFVYAGLLVLVVGLLVWLLLAYTPLNYLMPSKSLNSYRDDMLALATRVDSLENVIDVREEYFATITNLMDGRMETAETVADSVIERQKFDFAKNKHDSILQTLIEEEEQKTMAVLGGSNKDRLKKMSFYMPVKGTITSKFDENHPGIDIAAKGNEPILSTLPGTVIMATWSVETGHVIQVQHDNNMVSIYKHNSSLLKKAGDKVEAGEPIAIIGNSGEYTSGPHLHFELWHNGVAVNPEQYIAY